LLMLVVLVGLGTWQIYRLQWKEEVLAQIGAAEAAPPVPLTANPAPYMKVSATGHFRFDRAVQFGAEVRDTRNGPTMGFYQIAPLERDGAPTILVDRGWIPQKRDHPLDEPTGMVTVTAYVRPGEPLRWFSPADDEAARQFYTLDPEAIGAVMGIRNPMRFLLVALGSPAAEFYPAPARHLPRPPNNHLSYVITWYGLAMALAVIFGVWVRKERKARRL
jgi:surfeit locus 1 family protein